MICLHPATTQIHPPSMEYWVHDIPIYSPAQRYIPVSSCPVFRPAVALGVRMYLVVAAAPAAVVGRELLLLPASSPASTHEQHAAKREHEAIVTNCHTYASIQASDQ